MKKIVFILALFSLVSGLIILKSVLPASDRVSDIASVPLPSIPQEMSDSLNQNETIETFFSLVNSGKIEEATQILHSRIIPDNEVKNNWIKQFSIFKSIAVSSITKLNSDEEIYRVQLNVGDVVEDSSATIPNFGWNKGENVRWITLEKENNIWKISQIATGP